MSTALEKFQRLEATALWRETPDAQRRDVIVSLGDATLVIKDSNDRALTHWSLPAVRRLNPGERPAVFYPDGDPSETLEIDTDHPEVVEAIEKLRKAVANPGQATGRLRKFIFGGSIATIAALGIFLAAKCIDQPCAARCTQCGAANHWTRAANPRSATDR